MLQGILRHRALVIIGLCLPHTIGRSKVTLEYQLPQTEEYDGLTVMKSNGNLLQHLNQYDTVRPGEELTVRFLVPQNAEYSRVILQVNGRIIADRGFRRRRRGILEKDRTDIVVTMHPKERDSWLTFVAHDEDQNTLDSTILSVDGPGPFIEEPKDQCGIKLSDTKFTCAIHPNIFGELVWYLEMNGGIRAVAEGKKNYNSDLVNIKAEKRDDGSYKSILTIKKHPDPGNSISVNCDLIGHRTSQKATYYHPVLNAGNLELRVTRDGVSLSDSDKVRVGDKIDIQATTPSGNPAPGLKLVVNGKVVSSMSERAICGVYTNSSSLETSYTIGDEHKLEISVSMSHPLSKEETKVEENFHIEQGNDDSELQVSRRNPSVQAANTSSSIAQNSYVAIVILLNFVGNLLTPSAQIMFSAQKN